MTDEEIRQWQIAINEDPVNTDISKLDPAEYKFLDLYRELIMEYRQGSKTKAECQEIGKLLRKEYEGNKQTASRSLEVYREYQANIKRLDSLRIEINKAQTVEGKLRAALEIVGIVTGDGDFTNRNLKGIDENETR